MVAPRTKQLNDVEDIASEYSVELQALKNLEYFELKIYPTTAVDYS